MSNMQPLLSEGGAIHRTSCSSAYIPLARDIYSPSGSGMITFDRVNGYTAISGMIVSLSEENYKRKYDKTHSSAKQGKYT